MSGEMTPRSPSLLDAPVTAEELAWWRAEGRPAYRRRMWPLAIAVQVVPIVASAVISDVASRQGVVKTVVISAVTALITGTIMLALLEDTTPRDKEILQERLRRHLESAPD